MKIEFCFNSTTSLKLVPETSKDKQLLQLFNSEITSGIKVGAAGREQPDSLVIEVFTDTRP